MAWLTIFQLGLKGFVAFTDLLRDKQLMDAGAAKVIKESLEKADEEVSQALEAKRLGLRRFDDLGGLPDAEDPNLRD